MVGRPNRRAALVAIAGLAAASLSACDPQSGTPEPGAPATDSGRTKVKIGTIAVAAPQILAQNGEAVAGWVESDLPATLARAFRNHMAPGDPNAATLSVEISAVLLGTVGSAAGTIDSISGSATLSGGGVVRTTVSLTETHVAKAPPPGQSATPQEEGERVVALLEAFARALPGRFDL